MGAILIYTGPVITVSGTNFCFILETSVNMTISVFSLNVFIVHCRAVARQLPNTNCMHHMITKRSFWEKTLETLEKQERHQFVDDLQPLHTSTNQIAAFASVCKWISTKNCYDYQAPYYWGYFVSN